MGSSTKNTTIEQKRRDVFNYYRNIRHLEVKDIAEKCQYKPQTLYNALNKGIFSTEMAKKLSRVLGCSPDELLNGTLDDVVKSEIDAAKQKIDFDIVSDEILFMRSIILSQQRTIENLSYITKEEFQKKNTGTSDTIVKKESPQKS